MCKVAHRLLNAHEPGASQMTPALHCTSWLQYTTEKSVHQIVKPLKVRRITQTIDVPQKRVTNHIQFSDNTYLQASAPMRAVSNNRYGIIGMCMPAFHSAGTKACMSDICHGQCCFLTRGDETFPRPLLASIHACSMLTMLAQHI